LANHLKLQGKAVARIILLTEPQLADAVVPFLTAARATVDPVFTLPDLRGALGGDLRDTRLLSFGAGVIVPEAVLARLPGPAYNLHPGPPAYPGLFPSVYALYDGAPTFGITLHEMAPLVDSGPIVAVETFAVPAMCDRLTLDTHTFRAMVNMVARLALPLTNVAQPLPRIDAAWSGTRRTRRDFEALCRVPEDAGTDEFFRRLRAVGEGPHHGLTLTRFGREFRLVSQTGAPVVRGGQPMRDT
jgi:methionyl-tRNA formyltransferase